MGPPRSGLRVRREGCVFSARLRFLGTRPRIQVTESSHARGSFWKGIKGHSKRTLQSACLCHVEGRPGVCHRITDQREWHGRPLLGRPGTRRVAGSQGHTSRQLPHANEQRSPRGLCSEEPRGISPGHVPLPATGPSDSSYFLRLHSDRARGDRYGPSRAWRTREPAAFALKPSHSKGGSHCARPPIPVTPLNTGMSREVTCLRSELASCQHLLGVEAGSFAGKPWRSRRWQGDSSRNHSGVGAATY